MHEAFIADHALRSKLGWFLTIAMPLSAVSSFYAFASSEGDLRVLRGLAALSTSAVAVILIWGVFQRNRPIVELFDDRLEAMLVYQFVGRKRIPFDEIADVSLSGYRLRLTKRSGEIVTIKLGSLAPETRRRVVEAIEARIRARS